MSNCLITAIAVGGTAFIGGVVAEATLLTAVRSHRQQRMQRQAQRAYGEARDAREKLDDLREQLNACSSSQCPLRRKN